MLGEDLGFVEQRVDVTVGLGESADALRHAVGGHREDRVLCLDDPQSAVGRVGYEEVDLAGQAGDPGGRRSVWLDVGAVR
jgi:hypothetical protein